MPDERKARPSRQLRWKDRPSVFLVERYDLAQRNTRGKRARNDPARAGAHDQVEPLADIESSNAAPACEGFGKFAKVRAGVDAAHAAAVQAEHPERA